MLPDAHGPLAMAMCAGFDLIEAACETKFGDVSVAQVPVAPEGVADQHTSPNPAGIPDRPSGHCPQVLPLTRQCCARPVNCGDGSYEECGWCPSCNARRDALADARDWQREYASVSELDEAEQR